MSAFECLPFTPENLYTSLANDNCDVEKAKTKRHVEYILGYLKELGALSIVVENDYVDGDYLDDHSSYYGKCFRDYNRKCRRLHFFNEELDDSKVKSLIFGTAEEGNLETFVAAYLGFIVARPLPDAIIGRTLLKTYCNDNGRRHYNGIRKYTANFFGIELSIESLPFQEQDTVLAACATVALWCCFHKTSELFNTTSPTPGAITRAATKLSSSSRSFPSHGLNVEQICNAVRDVGLEPEIVQISNGVPLASLLYSHLHLGLPVILGVEVEGVGFHAITLNGYSLQENRHVDSEVGLNRKHFNMTGLRIKTFYAHDDQIGPFCRIYSESPVTDEYPLILSGSWKAGSGTFRRLLPKVAILPVYHKIRVTFIDIQEWIHVFNRFMSLILADQTKTEWNVRLTTTNAMKADLRKNGDGNEAREQLLLEQHPKFIWRATLIFQKSDLVELLFDATDLARGFPLYRVVWHDKEAAKVSKKIMELPIMNQLFSDPRMFQLVDESLANITTE